MPSVPHTHRASLVAHTRQPTLAALCLSFARSFFTTFNAHTHTHAKNKTKTNKKQPSTKKNLGDLLSKDSLKMHALGLLNAGQAAVDTGHVFTLYSVRFKRTTVGDGGVGTQIFSVYDVYPAPPGEDVPIIGRQYYVSTVIDSPPGGTEETRQSIYSFKIFPNASKVVAECCSEIDGFIAALKQAAADKNGVAVPTNDLEVRAGGCWKRTEAGRPLACTRRFSPPRRGAKVW